MEPTTPTNCPSCHYPNNGKYCSNCGQALAVKRITFLNLVHEIFHLFTHMDRGFLFTLRKLITSPGHMQRQYIEGNRSTHQKPFSMFFICATVFALLMYWINVILMNYMSGGNELEAAFFNRYMLMLLLGSVPFMIILTFIFFHSSVYNLAEIGVLILYATSVFLLIVLAINFLKFFWPAMETSYVELPAMVIYNSITFINFFNKSKKWHVAIKSIACSFIFYFSITNMQDTLIEKLLY